MQRPIGFIVIAVLISALVGCSSMPSFLSALFSRSPSRETERVLVVVPFLGEDKSSLEAIAESISRQNSLQKVFTKIIKSTQATEEAIKAEEEFMQSGVASTDSMVGIARKYRASHVLVGFLTQIRNRKLVIVSILEVETLQQIAGYYHLYDQIEEVDALIPEMASQLARFAKRDSANLPGLAVLPFSGEGLSKNEAHAMAQIIACELANGTAYAVLPRTDSLNVVFDEAKEEGGQLGRGRNALFVLSGSVQNLGKIKKIATDVLWLKDKSLLKGAGCEENATIDIIADIKQLAKRLEKTKPPKVSAFHGSDDSSSAPSNPPPRESPPPSPPAENAPPPLNPPAEKAPPQQTQSVLEEAKAKLQGDKTAAHAAEAQMDEAAAKPE